MKYLLWLSILILWLPIAHAGRNVPSDMEVAILKKVDYPYITLAHDGISWIKVLSLGILDKSKTFSISSNFRIRDERNRFIVRGRLMNKIGMPVAIKYRDGVLQELWVLSDEEKKVLKMRAQMVGRQGI